MKRISNSAFPSQSRANGFPSASEERRLAAVARYAILDTPREGAFDAVANVAARIFDVPIAIVSIVDHDRLWFKAAYGIGDVHEVPREPGLCSSAIEGHDPYVVEDAALDERSRSNSLVTGPLGVRFYVGIPLATVDGFNLGTLCVVDCRPREASPEKIDLLTQLAKIVVDELELRLAARRLSDEIALRERAEASGAVAEKTSLTDGLTGLQNRRALEKVLDGLYRRFRAGDPPGGAVAVVDIDGLKAVNDLRGHDVGDRFLRTFTTQLVAAFGRDGVFRYGGDEFVLFFALTPHPEDVRFRLAAAVRGARDQGFPEIDASFGLAAFDDVDGSPRGALRLADSRMYAAKVSRR